MSGEEVANCTRCMRPARRLRLTRQSIFGIRTPQMPLRLLPPQPQNWQSSELFIRRFRMQVSTAHLLPGTHCGSCPSMTHLGTFSTQAFGVPSRTAHGSLDTTTVCCSLYTGWEGCKDRSKRGASQLFGGGGQGRGRNGRDTSHHERFDVISEGRDDLLSQVQPWTRTPLVQLTLRW